MGVVGLAENIATQPSLAGAWAELGNLVCMLKQKQTEADHFRPKSC